MMKFLSSIFDFLFGWWTKIPEHVQEKIIDIIVNTFETILKQYYNQYKDQKSEEEKGK